MCRPHVCDICIRGYNIIIYKIMRIEIRNYFNYLLVGLDYPNLEELSSEQKTFIIGIGNYSDYNVEFKNSIVILTQNNIDALPETMESNYRDLVTRIVEYI